MRRNLRHVTLAAVLLGFSQAATAAEITISCGWQETEIRLCQEAAATWSAESGHTVTVQRALERSDERS